jgi:hypothetical protein
VAEERDGGVQAAGGRRPGFSCGPPAPARCGLPLPSPSSQAASGRTQRRPWCAGPLFP